MSRVIQGGVLEFDLLCNGRQKVGCEGACAQVHAHMQFVVAFVGERAKSILKHRCYV